MMYKPLVSVCMITYNHELYIEQAIEGVLMQECDFDVELIIADDNSPDHTFSMVKALKESHKNGAWINYTKHQKNKGMMSNFVWALNQCKGEYIALCDGDDYWTDSLKLQKQVDFLQANNDYAMCCHPCFFQDGQNKALRKQNLSTIDYDYTVKNLMLNWGIPTASIMLRNDEIFKNVPTWVKEVASGDIAVTLLLYEKGKFKLLEDYMSVYRLHDTGVSGSHKATRMIHKRAILYSKLNEYFDYNYEDEIYEALFELMLLHMPFLKHRKQELTAKELFLQLKDKVKKKLS